MLRRCRPLLSLVVFVFGAPALFGCGGTIEADPPGLGTLAPPDSAPLPTEPPAASPGSVQPSAPRPAVERGRTLFDLGIVTPLCMTRTGQHFLYLRRDGTGSAELRHLDLARSVDTTVVRRAEAILLAPRAYLETRFGADDLTDSERRTRCATDALGAHAVVHLVAGELLRVSLDTDTTERFTYDTERGDLRTLSISADARAILYSQGVVALGGRGARYLDTLTGKTIGVDEHFSAPPEIPGHCVFHPYTGIHYPAGAFHCENNINGGPTYVLQGGLFTPVPIRANRLGTTFFFAGGDEAKSIDLRTGAATPLPSMWIGARNSLPRVVSESPLRALWVPPFDPFASPSAEIATPSGLVPLPPSGWVQVAGPTSALGYRNGASNGTIVSWSYGASPPPTTRALLELPHHQVGGITSLDPDGSDPSTALVSAYCTQLEGGCSPETRLLRISGEVEKVGHNVTRAFAPRTERLAVVTYTTSISQATQHHVGILDARLHPHRLFTIATRTTRIFSWIDMHQAGTRGDERVLIADDEGCLRSTDLATRSSVDLEALVRARHGLGPCTQPHASLTNPTTLVAQGPAVRAVGLLFREQGKDNYRVVFVEP